jgi:hypothetical protein
MPRFEKKEIPAGFALREFPGNKWQAYRIAKPEQQSPIVTRRLIAINWALQQLGQEHAQEHAQK